MERVAWSDERLDDLSGRVDAGFDRLDKRFEQVDRRFDAVDRRFDAMERRFDDNMREMRGEFAALRITLVRVGGGIMAGLVGVIAAVLARGV